MEKREEGCLTWRPYTTYYLPRQSEIPRMGEEGRIYIHAANEASMIHLLPSMTTYMIHKNSEKKNGIYIIILYLSCLTAVTGALVSADTGFDRKRRIHLTDSQVADYQRNL